MEVPGWLLILLVILSVALLLLFVLCLILTIKNWSRRRNYDHIKPREKYVPGKLVACFKGLDKETHRSIIPKSYPAVLQIGNPLKTPAWRVISYTNPITSSTPSLSETSKYLETFHTYSGHRNNNSYQKSKPTSIQDMRRIYTPFSRMPAANPTSLKSSPSGSEGCDVLKTDGFYTTFVADECDQVYTHSDLLVNVDNNELFDESDAIISYDQDHHPFPRSSKLGSLFFILKYNPAAPELLVTVKSGIDLPPVNGGDSSPLNSYVNFCLVPEDFFWQRTKLIVNEKNPVFNETFCIRDVLYHKLREYTLCFFVMDCTHPLSERVIGKVLHPLSDLRARETVEVYKDLSSP